jgi:hypothetical protein
MAKLKEYYSNKTSKIVKKVVIWFTSGCVVDGKIGHDRVLWHAQIKLFNGDKWQTTNELPNKYSSDLKDEKSQAYIESSVESAIDYVEREIIKMFGDSLIKALK